MNMFYKNLFSLPVDILHDINGYQYIIVSNSGKLLDPAYISLFLHQAKTTRINFLSKEFDAIFDKIQEPLENTYLWFVWMREPQKSNDILDLPPSISLKIVNSDEISLDEKKYLMKTWESQYIETIYCNSTHKNKLLASKKETLNEGTHLLYYSENILLAHGSYVEDFNEAIQQKNYYLHLWIDQTQPKSTRLKIRKHFFDYTGRLELPLSAGVSARNIKALKTFKHANFSPLMLSIRINSNN